MAEIVWIDPRTHWAATVRRQSHGSFRAGTVEDTNGVTRGRDLSFTSKEDFIAWVGRLTG